MDIFLFPGISQHIYVYLVIINFFGLMCTCQYRKKSKINKDKNGENMPHLEITEVVLIHCDIVNND